MKNICIKLKICILVITILISFFLGSTASCQQPEGISAFQIMSNNWTTKQCKNLKTGLKLFRYPAFSVLYGSFGNNTKCLYNLITTINRKKWVQIHLSNEVARRNNTLTKRDLLPEFNVIEYNRVLQKNRPRVVRAIMQRLARIVRLTKKGKKITWNLSLGLESNYTKKAVRNLYNIIRTAWPYEISYSPITNNFHGLDAMRELHGYGARAKKYSGNCIQNGDGTGIFDIKPNGSIRNYSLQQVREWRKRCRRNSCICLLWDEKWQGRDSNKFVEPSKRNFKFNKSDIAIIRRIIL